MPRAVFLDRDGVINDVVHRGATVSSPRTLDEFRLCDNIRQPLDDLKASGFRLFVVSNQPDVARGLLDPRLLAEMNGAIREALPIDDVLVCPHDDGDACDCRKPKPGLIRRAAAREHIALASSYVIGDSWKDIEAGRGAGCRTILLRRPYNAGTTADHVVDSLSAAARLVTGDMSKSTEYVETYLDEVRAIAAAVNREAMTRLVDALAALRTRGGRLFLLGVGGSAANASHAANDFRKIAGIEAYCPTDNVAELTARINDEGWDTAYAGWLTGSRISERDAVLVFSVGGGSSERGISVPLVRAIDTARAAGAAVLGIVGRDGGYTAGVATACVIVPTVDAARVTPHTESFQAVLWHLLVSHPALQAHATKWESSASAESSVPKAAREANR